KDTMLRLTSKNLIAVIITAVMPFAFAQNATKDIPIRTWSAPAFWDGASLQKEQSTIETKANDAGLHPSAVTGTPLTGALGFVAIVPCRLVDTRGATGETGAFGPPIMSAGQTRTIPVRTNTRCNIPATAQAYSLNFTVVPTTFLGFLSAWPTGNQPSPLVSIL